MTSHRLTFCDLSPFYCDAGGGIRAYHRARPSRFSHQTRYRYVLVSLGPAFRVERLTSSVTTVQVYGPQLTRHRDGYRLMLAWTGIRDVLRWLSPDVLETGDPDIVRIAGCFYKERLLDVVKRPLDWRTHVVALGAIAGIPLVMLPLVLAAGHFMLEDRFNKSLLFDLVARPANRVTGAVTL
jgi:hypothetical protein